MRGRTRGSGESSAFQRNPLLVSPSPINGLATDPYEAMKEGAPIIHAYRPNNVSVEYHWNFGDVEKAFAKSYLVREDRFKTTRATKG